MTPAAATGGDPAAKLLPALKQAVIDRTGLGYYANREEALMRKVAARMAVLGLADQVGYFERLHIDAGEWDDLIDELTVGETYFFRYRAQFDALRDLAIPQCVARKGADRQLRIWCAGCATGAEPYSILLLAREELSQLLAGWKLSIVATDINRRYLQRAERGLFTNWELRDLPDRYRDRYFQHDGSAWRLGRGLAADICFQAQNLVQDAPEFARRHAGEFDIVFCRNVMIYFDQETNRRVLRALHTALAPTGWLFVGHAEPYLEIANVFHPHPVTGAMLYRKQAGDEPLTIAPPPAVPAGATKPPAWQDAFAATPIKAPTFAAEPRPPPAPLVIDEGTRASEPAAVAPVAATRRLDEVRSLANAAKWSAALSLCGRLLQEDDLDPEAHYLHGQILDHCGQAAASEAALRRALFLDRNFALAHYHLGLSSAVRGDAAQAVRALRNARQALRDIDDTAEVRAGDGLRAAELRALVAMQLRLHGGEQ